MIEHKKKSKNWDKENTFFIFLFVITIVIVYYAPSLFVTRVAFLLLLPIVYRSKKDYFWLAWFFLINDPPGGLTGSGGGETENRIPIYTILSGISIGFTELFYITMLLKTIMSNRISLFAFKKQFQLFWFFTFILILYTFIQEQYLDTFVRSFRVLLPWTLIFIVYKLMNSEKDFYRFCKLLFPFAIITIIIQITSYFIGSDFHSLLSGQSYAPEDTLAAEQDILYRTVSSSFIVFFITISAIFYKIRNTKEFSSVYLNILIFISFLSMILTGTRGWILAYILMFSLIIFSLPLNIVIKRIVSMVISGIIFFYILTMIFPIIGTQVEYSFKRLETVGRLAQGDITAGGTLSRLDVRGPILWAMAKERLILGYGFTDYYFVNEDGHVAHLNILFNSGIIGTIILNYIFFSIFYKILKLSKARNFISGYGSSLKIFAFALIGIYVIHSTSGQLWGYSGMAGSTFLYAFLLGFVCAIYNDQQSMTKIRLSNQQSKM